MAAKRSESDDRSQNTTFPSVELVVKAQAGDQTAFHRLMDHFQPEIFRMIYYRSRSQMDAEDLTQDVMLKVYKNIGRLKSPEVFRSWLYRIAVNRVRDYYRKIQFKSLFGLVSMDEENFYESEEMAVAPEAEGVMSRKDFWYQIEQMLTTLSNMEKEVFLLRFFDQLTIKEISVALKKNESTVKTHLYRALRKFKSMAGDLDGLMEGI